MAILEPERRTLMSDKDPEHRPEQPAYRSATANAALGLSAASPFLTVGAQAGKEWVAGKLKEKKEQPKVELPPGVDGK
jgi:hypothetical protein